MEEFPNLFGLSPSSSTATYADLAYILGGKGGVAPTGPRIGGIRGGHGVPFSRIPSTVPIGGETGLSID